MSSPPDEHVESSTSTNAKLYEVADALRVLANVGLEFSGSSYDRERYERLLSLAAQLVATVEQRPSHEVLDIFRGSLGRVTPSLAADAAVIHDGRLLLIRRADDRKWALPGGLVDVGETLAEAAVRELREETGVEARATRLLGIWDSRLSGAQEKTPLFMTVFEAVAHDPRPEPTAEAIEVDFFAEHEMPDELSPGHHVRVPGVFRLLRGADPVPYVDIPDRARPP